MAQAPDFLDSADLRSRTLGNRADCSSLLYLLSYGEPGVLARVDA
jgi:hypothetical protein